MSTIHSAVSMKIKGCGLALVLAGLATGCAPDEPEQTTDDSENQALLAPISQQTTLPNPNGTFFASVTANGTGCPPGSWTTDISSDGQTFTTTFSKYEAMLDATSTVSVKDCTLTIKLHSPQGLSYSVTNFYYSGYAFLEQGVSGKQEASYYFQGNPVPGLNTTTRTNLIGPYDKSYIFADEIKIADAVWSPCGLDRNLLAVTKLRLANSSPRRAGYMNLNAVDGKVGKLVLTLNWRACPTGTTSGN